MDIWIQSKNYKSLIGWDLLSICSDRLLLRWNRKLRFQSWKQTFCNIKSVAVAAPIIEYNTQRTWYRFQRAKSFCNFKIAHCRFPREYKRLLFRDPGCIDRALELHDVFVSSVMDIKNTRVHKTEKANENRNVCEIMLRKWLWTHDSPPVNSS